MGFLAACSSRGEFVTIFIYIYIFVTILHGVLGYCYRPGVFDLASTKLSA